MTHRKGPKPHKENQRWTTADVQKLSKMARGNTPTDLIADAMGRTEAGIRSKASDKRISLRPTNKSPYNRRRG